LADLKYRLQLKQAVYDSNLRRKEVLERIEWERILANWPLRLYQRQLKSEISSERAHPLKVLISPVLVPAEKTPSSDLADIGKKIDQAMGDFLTAHYPTDSPIRPVEFLGGAWDASTMRHVTAVKAIFGLLAAEPTVIFDSEIIGDDWVIRMGYWGLGYTTFRYDTVAKLPMRHLLFEVAREHARAWRRTREVLRQGGRSPEAIEEVGGQRAKNLRILEAEEEARRLQIDPSDLSLPEYNLEREDWGAFARILEMCHCLLAASMADIHHFTHYRTMPRLPEVLGTELQRCNIDLRAPAIRSLEVTFAQAYRTLFLETEHDSAVLYECGSHPGH
jgi:hypothetical protein